MKLPTRILFASFFYVALAIMPNTGYTPLRKGDIIAIHTSAFYSPTKLPHIPLTQLSPPECPPPKDPWHDSQQRRRVPTNSDHQTRLTMFRRGMNHTLGQLMLGSNIQVSPFFLQTGMDMHNTVACNVEFFQAFDECLTLMWLKEQKTRTTWYLDGVPSLYTPLEQHHIDQKHLKNITEEGYDDAVDEFMQDVRREVFQDLDSFEIGFPSLPTDQSGKNTHNVVVWTHYHIRVYFREHEDETYEIVGFEVVPSQPKNIPCDDETVHRYEITYSVSWFRNMASWDTRAKLYLFHQRHRFEIELGGIAAALFCMIMVSAFGVAWIQYNIKREQLESERIDPTLTLLIGWKSMGGSILRGPMFSFLWAACMGIGAQMLSLGFVAAIIATLFSFYVGSATSVVELVILASSALYVINGIVTVYAMRSINRITVSVNGEGVPTDHIARYTTVNGILAPRGVVKPILVSFIGSASMILLLLIGQQIIMSNFNSSAFVGWEDLMTGYFAWLSISGLCMMAGSAVGWTLSQHPIPTPCQIEHIPRPVLQSPVKGYGAFLLGVVICLVCTLAGGGIFITVFQSSWGEYVYAMYGTTIIVCICYIGICAIGALVFAFQIIKWEDWIWWWKTPIVGGSSAIFLFVILIFYVKVISNVRDSLAQLLMITEAFAFCVCVFFALFFVTGTCSFFFVHYIYKLPKKD